MNITATTEKSPNEIAIWKTYNGNYWSAVRLVGWISQDKTNNKTTLYFKWQEGADKYYCYWLDSHDYKVSLGGTTKTNSFSLPQATDGWKDLTTAQSITVTHGSDGKYTGTLNTTGYKFWEAFNTNVSVTFPTITVTPDPTPTPTPDDEDGAPIVNDTNPRYYIYADDELLYNTYDEDHIVINPRLRLKLNNTDELTFTLPPGNALYSSLSKLRTTLTVKQGNDILFKGRILDDTADFQNRKDVHAEGALAFLGDTIKAPYEYGTYKTAKDFFKAVMNEHYAQAPSTIPDRRIKYVRCTVSADVDLENLEYSQTTDALSELLDQTNGYLKLEYYQDGQIGLSYLNGYDHTSSQVIRFGENLLDISQFIDASSVYTSVVALGKADDNGKRLTTGSGSAMYTESQDAINLFGRIIKTITFDDVEDVATLRTLAQQYLNLGIQTATTITISAVDLHLVDFDTEKIRIGDAVRIISAPHNIDAYFQCSEIMIDMQNPDNSTYTFGSTVSNLTDSTSRINSSVPVTSASSSQPGTTNYNDLENKPSINGVILTGNKTSADLGIATDNVHIDTTANWDLQSSLVSQKGHIYVYTDYETVDGVVIPAVKIGDGNAYLKDMPFVDGNATSLRKHINNTTVHVTSQEKLFWNEKMRCFVSQGTPETLIFTTE